MQHERKRILVIRPGALGDTVLTAPVVAALRAKYLGSHIEVAGRMDYLPVLAGEGLADGCRSLDSPEFGSLFGDGAVRIGAWDIIVAFLPDEDGRLRGRLESVCAKVVVHDPRPAAGARRHITTHLLGALRPLGIRTVRRPTRIGCQRPWWSDGAEAVGHLDPHYVVVHPGSGGREKLWPAERWAEVIRGLAPRNVVLTCGPADEEVVEEVLACIGCETGRGDETAERDEGGTPATRSRDTGGTPAIRAQDTGRMPVPHITGQTPASRRPEPARAWHIGPEGRLVVVRDQPVTTLAGVLAAASVYLGCDSGVTHLAAALGVRTVAVFTTTDPRVWSPKGQQVHVLSGSDIRVADVMRAAQA